ncbi:class I SAM-dependent methyltransferase [Microbacterium sp. NPDC057650]|uniref:class I SAM-dependent methyltransferase n=1 Tax=unclassified Microbacterium TaxID=2609290 RepID=UPI00366D4B4B
MRNTTTDRTTAEAAPDYLFESGSRLGAVHLDALSTVLDRHTLSVLDALPLPEYPRCLEVGAGNGSVARAIAERTDGEVLAIDLDPGNLIGGTRVEVRQHDIRDSVPGGPYDLIHARLVMLHLPEREQILPRLVEALAPGGWLVLGDISEMPAAVALPEDGDRAVWDRYAHAAYDIVGPQAGQSYAWASEMYERMLDAGLRGVRAEAYRPLTRGGDTSARCHVNLSIQGEGPLLRAGLSAEDLRRYREIMRDPRLRAWFYEVVYAWGRRPVPRGQTA